MTVRSFVCAFVRVEFLPSIHSVRFGQLLRCAHQRIVNIMKLYIESNNIQVELIRFRKNIDFIHVYFFKPMKSSRLACLRLDSRYNISLYDSNRFITSPLFCAQSLHGSPSQMCMFDKRQFEYNRLLFSPFLTV